MNPKQFAFRVFLTGLVVLLGFLPLLLTGCGVTSWQRMMDSHQALHSPAMEAAIAEARR